jgi:Tol biopolymer transport system component
VLRRVTPWHDDVFSDASLTTDGSQIAWSNSQGIFVRDLASGQQRKLDLTFATGISWSPDGRRIAYASWPGRWIRVLHLDGRRVAQLPADTRLASRIARFLRAARGRNGSTVRSAERVPPRL